MCLHIQGSLASIPVPSTLTLFPHFTHSTPFFFHPFILKSKQMDIFILSSPSLTVAYYTYFFPSCLLHLIIYPTDRSKVQDLQNLCGGDNRYFYFQNLGAQFFSLKIWLFNELKDNSCSQEK